MLMRHWCLILALLVLPSLGLAANLGFDHSAVRQRYESNSFPPYPGYMQASPQPAAKTSGTPAKNPSSSAQAKASANAGTVGTQQTAQINATKQAISVLQAEFSRLNHSRQLFQQAAQQHIVALEHNNRLLQEQLMQLQQALTLLNRQVSGLVAESNAQHAAAAQTGWRAWSHKLGGPVPSTIIVAAAVIIILLLILIVWPRGRRRQLLSPDQQLAGETHDLGQDSDQAADDTDEEYDYMGSSESIPAKLNLARAYLAMEDYKLARQTLTEVISQGDQEQQAAANSLLKQIPS